MNEKLSSGIERHNIDLDVQTDQPLCYSLYLNLLQEKFNFLANLCS